MPQLVFPRGSAGWVVPALIGLDHSASVAIATAGINIPPPIRVNALIDSGSNVSCISASVLQQLPLITRGTHTTQTVSGSASVRLFDVSLSIIPLTGQSSPIFTIPDLLIMELPQSLDDTDMLIGLDVLDQCQTLMDGPGKLLTINF